jgi:hypothetical protein
VTRKFLFADESGNFDFRDHTKYPGATRYFAVGTMMIESEVAMRKLRDDLANLRYELLDNGLAVGDEFHATDDKQPVRNAVFDVLRGHDFKLDVTILEKAKAQPQTRYSDPTFYKYAWFYHLKYFADRYFKPQDELTVVSAALGTKKSRKVFSSAVEDVVDQCCHYEVKRKLAFWPSATDPCLQAVDYALWAVMRDIEQGDDRSRKLLVGKINSVFDLWSWGNKYYYGPKASKPKSA